MLLLRRYAAAVLAASALTLGACGSEAPTTPDAGSTDGAVVDSPRHFALSPATVTFTRNPGEPLPTQPQWTLVQGIIAAASFPFFAEIIWSAGASGWFDRSTTPMFSNLPALGWNFSFWLNQNAAALPEGFYEAWIAVTVPAALNNPQMLRVVYDYCLMCLRLGDAKVGDLSTTDPTWSRGSDINAPGGYVYDDWRLFVEPGQTVYVQHIGGSYNVCSDTGPLGTLSDPYLYLFETDGTFITSSDDSCGYSSEIQVTNATGVTKEYLVRYTHYAVPGDPGWAGPTYNFYGTYLARVVGAGFSDDLRAEPTPEEQAGYDRKRGNP